MMNYDRYALCTLTRDALRSEPETPLMSPLFVNVLACVWSMPVCMSFNRLS